MDYKRLLTQVERTLEQIDTREVSSGTLEQIAETIATNFRDDLGITGGRLYHYTDDDTYELVGRFGESRGDVLGIIVPADYKPMELVRDNGVIVMEPNDPAVDPILEQKLGASRFAAISVGDEDYVLGFDVAPELSRDDIHFSLNLIRYAINQKVRAQRYEALITEAQRIQQSILPQRIPQYEGFDIWGKTLAAEIVSGDFYDFIPLTDNILGLAIADGSGHGLPAALIVRDVYMGLRMATDRDFKIVRTMQKLNHILHRSRMTTKFVSLFYGELETGGILIYTNAGHNFPFVLKGDSVELLKNGGPVLGPTPDATYTRGFTRLEAGDLLCMYSDGLVEAHQFETGEEFGLDRLMDVVRKNRQRTAQEIGQAAFARVAEWGPAEDDRTVVIVKALANV